ncbi:hypothetical protein EUGRSUZ_H03708 [Eucalyptus grandis]|uniref:Uncharacterized protein n=2 Tax=Eucalyptus grandis TaxID=71139 RepID=A0ACC3JUX7_EUCGR|nr:hypothetical protein EUGRSUZ_H03708 [Eucalyptus grandis]
MTPFVILYAKKLERFGKNSSAMIGAGEDSGAGFGCNSEISADQEMGSVFESFKARCQALFADLRWRWRRLLDFAG